MAAPESREAAVALHRQNINLRSVTRNDPSAVEILETSAYSTIYHFEDPEWEKQKMEGPTFIIRRGVIERALMGRDKQPFHAIYMLNRQTVKNVTIPLIPGEIKLTVVKEDMLQIARRGEKVKRAMWFSEGEDGVERFRSKILEICGEPSKIISHGTPASASSASVPFTSPSPAPAPTDDGFSRLFAGLMPSSSSTPTPISGLPTRSDPPYQPARTAEPPKEVEVFPEAPILQNRDAPTSQPEPTPSTGQTADDLLMSILGMAPPPRPATASSPAPPLPSAPPRTHTPSTQQMASAPPASQFFNGSPSMLPPIPGPPRQQSPFPSQVMFSSQPPRRGSPMSPPPIPTETKPHHASPQFGEQDLPALGKTPSRSNQPPSPTAYSHIVQPRSPVQHRYPDTLRQEPNPHAAFNHPRSVTAPHQIPNGHQLPLGDPGIGAVALTMAKAGFAGVAADSEGKRLFMDTLLRRIHVSLTPEGVANEQTEPAFVDELWGEYLRLTRGAIG